MHARIGLAELNVAIIDFCLSIFGVDSGAARVGKWCGHEVTAPTQTRACALQPTPQYPTSPPPPTPSSQPTRAGPMGWSVGKHMVLALLVFSMVNSLHTMGPRLPSPDQQPSTRLCTNRFSLVCNRRTVVSAMPGRWSACCNQRIVPDGNVGAQ